MPKSFSKLFSKSFFSDDPFAVALDDHRRGRRPASPWLLLLIPTLGIALMVFGMQARPGAGTPVLAMDAGDLPSRSEGRAGLLVSIAEARRNVFHWQRESRSAATPRSRAKLRDWERGYRQRRALLARMYPE